MADIIVDTYKLNQYAQRIDAVNRRINRLDRRLDSLYARVGLQGLWNLMQMDALTCFSWRLLRCQAYLQQTATEFEQVERDLLKEDPMTYRGMFIGKVYAPAIQIIGKRDFALEEHSADLGKTLWNSIKSEIADIPEDAKSAGEALAWIEKQYGKLPNWVTLGVDVLVPSSLQDAYTLTSGILQGDLTLKEGWDVAKHILSENTKLAVICETLDYTFEIGTKRYEEMEKELYAQIAEGDILGAVFDGAEGFIDTIIGGSIDVLGDVGGGAVDAVIDNIPVVKGINMLTEYGTGLLGWNDGEGYSVGGLIGGATEKISEGLDVVTDVITDTTDVITDAVTGGFKSGVKWVKSWFD